VTYYCFKNKELLGTFGDVESCSKEMLMY